ncbi:MAG: ROK family protein [Planctomycetes bacterium]|nr:ROK family protein [Planctomycetota bacterium]
MTKRIGFDIGGTNLKAGLIEGAQILARVSEPTPHHAHEMITVMKKMADDLLGENPHQYPQIGVAVPGVPSPKRPELLGGPNLLFLKSFDLWAALTSTFGQKVAIGNDATVAALGEARLGAGAEHHNFLLITIGTGVGGGLVLNGETIPGTGAMAGEIGHLKIGHKVMCGCGHTGCLEALASARSMEREGGLPLRELADKARNGDANALSIFQTSGASLGQALAQVLLTLDIRVFLFGGGGGPVLDLLEPSLLDTLIEQTHLQRRQDFTLKPASLGNDAGWVGAAFLST